MADLLFDFNIQRTAQILDEDNSLKKVLMDYGLYIPDTSIDEPNPERIKVFEDLAYEFLANHDFISDRSIDDLWELQFLVGRINQIFNRVNVVDEVLYRQLMFSYKYSTIKHFFRDNFTKFLPSLDASVIEDSEKMSLFQSAFMQEYDRFADIIDNIYNITDIDKVGNDYISYLVQILGYEQKDDKLLGKDSFRELAKNIVEVYKMKGTNYSFELFFNFLGFDVELNEFYFDKRFHDSGITLNPYTGSDNPEDFSFYLTPYKPTIKIPDNMNNPHQVHENDLTDIRSHLWWQRKLLEGNTVEKLLGEDPNNPPEDGFDYTYFKTNIIQYSVQRIRSKETDADELSQEDEAIIQAYADFLTPIFIAKQVLISVKPFEDIADNLVVKDRAIYNSDLETWESMFRAQSNWYIYDDWVEDPTADVGNRFSLDMKEETDVESNGIDTEEQREYYLFIKTHNHNSPSTFETKDDMTEMSDGDETSDEWIPSPNFFKVHATTAPNTDLDSGPDDAILASVYDLLYTDKVLDLHLVWNLFPYDDGDTPVYGLMQGLQKILDFDESLFNRVHRLEDLNVLNRDYTDWDDFSISRRIPNFEDSFEQDFELQQFDLEDSSGGNDDVFITNDDDATHTPWWFYDKLTMKKTTYNFIGFGFVHTSTEVKGELHVERVGGYPPGYSEFEDPIVTNGSLEPQDFLIEVRPVHLGFIKMSGAIGFFTTFDQGNDFALADTSTPDNIAFREGFIYLTDNNAKVDMFGITELNTDLSDIPNGIFVTQFISSNKDVWATVNGGSILSSGLADTTLDIIRNNVDYAIGIFTGTYESNFLIAREYTGSISTSSSADYEAGEFSFPEYVASGSIITDTPFIRAENEGFLFENVSDYALAQGTGSSLQEVLRTVINDFAIGVLSYQDIVAFVENLVFKTDSSVLLSAFYETDILGIIENPIFITDNAPVIQTNGGTAALLVYELFMSSYILAIQGQFETSIVQEATIIASEIITSGSGPFILDTEFLTNGGILTSGTAYDFYEIIANIIQQAITASGSTEVDQFIITPRVSILHDYYLMKTGGIAPKTIDIERESLVSLLTSGTNPYEWVIERDAATEVNINSNPTTSEVDRIDVDEVGIGAIFTREIVNIENTYGIAEFIRVGDFALVNLSTPSILADSNSYNYLAGNENGLVATSGTNPYELVIERDNPVLAIASGTITYDDFIITREMTGGIVGTADVNGDTADYVEPVIGGSITLYGTQDDNVKYYKYTAEIVESSILTSSGNITADIIYDYLATNENGVISTSGVGETSPEIIRESQGTVLTSGTTNYVYEIERTGDGGVSVLTTITDSVYELERIASGNTILSGTAYDDFIVEGPASGTSTTNGTAEYIYEIERTGNGGVVLSEDGLSLNENTTYNTITTGTVTASVTHEYVYEIERTADGGGLTLGTTTADVIYDNVVQVALVTTSGNSEAIIEITREASGTALTIGISGVSESDVQYDYLGQSASMAFIYSGGSGEYVYEIERTVDGVGLTLGTTTAEYELTRNDGVATATTGGSGDIEFELIREGGGAALTTGTYERVLEMNAEMFGEIATSYIDILADLDSFIFEPTVSGSVQATSNDITGENIYDYINTTDTVTATTAGESDELYEITRVGDFADANTSGLGEWLYVIEREHSGGISTATPSIVADSATTT